MAKHGSDVWQHGTRKIRVECFTSGEKFQSPYSSMLHITSSHKAQQCLPRLSLSSRSFLSVFGTHGVSSSVSNDRYFRVLQRCLRGTRGLEYSYCCRCTLSLWVGRARSGCDSVELFIGAEGADPFVQVPLPFVREPLWFYLRWKFVATRTPVIAEERDLYFRCVCMIFCKHYPWRRGGETKVVVLLYVWYFPAVWKEKWCPVISWHHLCILSVHELSSIADCRLLHHICYLCHGANFGPLKQPLEEAKAPVRAELHMSNDKKRVVYDCVPSCHHPPHQVTYHCISVLCSCWHASRRRFPPIHVCQRKGSAGWWWHWPPFLLHPTCPWGSWFVGLSPHNELQIQNTSLGLEIKLDLAVVDLMESGPIKEGVVKIIIVFCIEQTCCA